MDAPVLLTGWAGRVGQAILDEVGDQYEWRLFDRQPPAVEDPPGTVFVGDITDRDRLAEAMEDVSVVIHLAGDPRADAPWDSLLPNNVDGTQAVFETAVDIGVQKVAFASSNHAVGAYETDDRVPNIYRPHAKFLLDGSEPYRPGNLYGASKAAGEILGRYYHDAHGISVVNVRIGNLTPDRPPRDYERGHSMWLSHRDCAHLFECCIEADYEYEIVYGISDNDQKFYSIERAKDVLGYRPKDNAADHVDMDHPESSNN